MASLKPNQEGIFTIRTTSDSVSSTSVRVMAPFVSRSIALVAALLIVPVTRVSACEDDCKANITTALVGNYSVPVNFVFAQLVRISRSHLACMVD